MNTNLPALRQAWAARATARYLSLRQTWPQKELKQAASRRFR